GRAQRRNAGTIHPQEIARAADDPNVRITIANHAQRDHVAQSFRHAVAGDLDTVPACDAVIRADPQIVLALEQTIDLLIWQAVAYRDDMTVLEPDQSRITGTEPQAAVSGRRHRQNVGVRKSSP